MSNRYRALFFAIALPVLGGSAASPIENLQQLNDHVYRGAQPSDRGFQYLATLGVKTVIDLREADELAKAEESMVTAAGMKFVNVPMTGLTPPTDAEITRILAILEDDSSGPVFVHCKRGADRTGAVIAAYRIDHDHWDGRRALEEAKSLGMGSFQAPRRNYIRNFQARPVETAAMSTTAAASSNASAASSTTAAAR